MTRPLPTEDPAKFARGLIHRIYRHLIEQGYVRPGAVVLDPFGGVALGALDALTYGLRWIGCELEPRFVTLGQQNLELWRQRYGFTGGTIVQGDSRNLRSVLAGAQAQCVVGSPPFMDQQPSHASAEWHTARAIIGDSNSLGRMQSYGTSPGQLGAMPPGQVGCVVGSPPYAESCVQLGQIDWSKTHHGSREAAYGRGSAAGVEATPGYGTTPGQLGAMPPGALVSSPLRGGWRGPRHAQRYRLVQGAGGRQGGNPGPPGQWRGVWHGTGATGTDAARARLFRLRPSVGSVHDGQRD